MAVSFVAATTYGDGNGLSTYTINYPAGTASGDLIIIEIAAHNAGNASAVPVLTTPSGWTALSTATRTGGGGVNAGQSTDVIYRIRAAETSVAVTYSTGAVYSVVVYALRGTDQTTPVGQTALALSDTSPSITPATRETFAVVGFTANQNASSTAPAGYTNTWSGFQATSNLTVLLASKGVSGSTGAGVWSGGLGTGVVAARTIMVKQPNSAPNTPTTLTPTGTTSTAKPTVGAIVTDVDGDNCYAYFQVATDSGFGSIVFQGQGSTVASGAASTLVVTGLAASTTYYYRAYASDGSLTSAYSAASTFTTAAPLTTSFAYSGADQSFVVPTGITSLTVDIQGAQGGAGSGGLAPPAAGLGGRTTGTLAVTPGQTLIIEVGQAGAANGSPAAGMTYGGGAASVGLGAATQGGGRSSIYNGSKARANFMAVAGGGGGGAWNGGGGDPAQGSGAGGGGGGTTGTSGGQVQGNPGGGVGGSQTVNGANSSGTPGDGGGGGGDGTNASGGGGGGYFGGGGGNLSLQSYWYAGGGGGGSGYVGSMTGAAMSNGYRSGHGIINLSYPNYNAAANQTPSVPTALASNAATRNLGLSATVSDPDGGYVYAYFQVATDTGFASVVFQGQGATVTSGGSSTITASGLNAHTTYYVRAYSSDGSLSSAYSAYITSTTPDVAPNVPVLNAPVAGAVLSNGANTYSWTYSDSDPNDTVQGGYQFRRYNSNTAVTDYWNGTAFQGTAVTVSTSTQSVVIPAGAWTAGQYTWTVANTDSSGTLGPFATAIAVTITGGFSMMI